MFFSGKPPVLMDIVDLMPSHSYCGCFDQFHGREQTSTVPLAAPIYTHLNPSSSFVDKFCIRTESASPLAHSEKSSHSHLSTSVIIHPHISSQEWTPSHYFQQTVIILDTITGIMKFPLVHTSRPNIGNRKLPSLSDTLTFHDTTASLHTVSASAHSTVHLYLMSDNPKIRLIDFLIIILIPLCCHRQLSGLTTFNSIFFYLRVPKKHCLLITRCPSESVLSQTCFRLHS